MTVKLKKNIPSRSAGITPKKRYRDYKPSLREDFSRRCGYCDDHDETFGGVRGFHIDHFAPKSLFPRLEVTYGNLVYSCPFCNIAKSNKWIGSARSPSYREHTGFIDPCDEEIDLHLARSRSGRIISRTPLGRYMIDNLKLDLIRHQLNWQIEKIRELQANLIRVTKLANDNGIDISATIEVQNDLLTLLETYIERRHEA